jgi:hypothetical protein
MPTALNDLLKATSRSFYLTLGVPPSRHREFPPSLQDVFLRRLFPETASLANIQRRFATKRPVVTTFNCVKHYSGAALRLVPKAQPEISQTRSVWYHPTEFNPSRRDGGNIHPTSRFEKFLSPFRTNQFAHRIQTLRVWLISGVAPRHRKPRVFDGDSNRAPQNIRVCHQPI